MTLKVWQIDAAQLTPFYNLALSTGLAEAGCEVTYIASPYIYTALEYPPNINVDLLYFRGLNGEWLMSSSRLRKILRGLYYPFDNWRLLRKIQKARPDIVHFQWSRLPRFDMPLIRAIRKLNIPVVHTIHDVIPLFEKGAVPALYEIYRECDALIVHSEANRQSLLDEVENLDHKKIYTLPLVESPFPEPVGASRTKARELTGIPQGAFVVLFFGIVKHYKGIDILLDSIKAVNAESNEFTWLIVGKADDSSQQAYLNQIKQLERSYVTSEYIPNKDVWMYYRAANLCVFPYRHIFQSAALIAAMDFSLPVIATDVGSFPETIRGNGIIIPHEDSHALTKAILDIINYDDLEALGEKSMQILDDHHRANKVGQLLYEIYVSLS